MNQYIPFYPFNQVPVPATQPLQARNGITWVQGVEGAKAMQVPANGVELFMDSENEGIFYIKTTDNIGISTMRTFKYEEITQKPVANPEGFITRKEFEEAIAALKGGTDEQSVPATEPTDDKGGRRKANA